MNSGCCLNCQAKATKKMKKKIKEESDEDSMKQEQKILENENPKTDSNDKKKKKKKKGVLTWQHSSTKKEKSPSKNLLSKGNDVNPPCSTAKSMMNYGCPNPSNRWAISAVPRPHYPAFPMAPPMYGPYGGGGGPIQPYNSMFNGAHISPYPPMGAAAPFPYRGTRPYMDSNPMKRYTTYAHNYSYLFI